MNNLFSKFPFKFVKFYENCSGLQVKLSKSMIFFYSKGLSKDDLIIVIKQGGGSIMVWPSFVKKKWYEGKTLKKCHFSVALKSIKSLFC